jgi:ankyrin repeat protein
MGAELEVQNNEGITPLQMSVLAQNIRICNDLILKGAERSTKNSKG